ncbi:uncharacterized protein LOC134221136 [Armigeres subalbatus]|uniref:uncharacterized protein LOC134221136 n=1 Tax=Armigeres subalbatus TaxID=124917 RepID=UPI002ED13FBD
MDQNMSIHRYYHRTKEIVQNIKTLSKQNTKYRDNWDAINTFIDEDGLAAFISGLRGNYFGHAQAARPKDIEDAYAFLCKFKSQEINASNMEDISKAKNSNGNNSKDSIEPMETDSSLQSRLTYNKKLINNNEVASEYELSASEDSSDDDEEKEVNFCQANRVTRIK